MASREHYKWPFRRVVAVRRPGMGRVHYFIFECGHAKIERLPSYSRWDEVNEGERVPRRWSRKCPVCYAEQMRESEPEITIEYVESLLGRIDLED